MECKKFYKRNFARKTIIIKKLKNRYTMENLGNNELYILPKNEWLRFSNLLQMVANKLLDTEIKTSEQSPFLTVAEYLEMFKISRSQFEILKREGTIKVYKQRGKVYVKRSEAISTLEKAAL